MLLALIFARLLAPDALLALEPCQLAAQKAMIHRKALGQRFGGDARGLRELVQDTQLGQAVGTFEVMFVQRADGLGVIAVKAADGLNVVRLGHNSCLYQLN